MSRACVCARVRVCVRACVCACVCVIGSTWLISGECDGAAVLVPVSHSGVSEHADLIRAMRSEPWQVLRGDRAGRVLQEEEEERGASESIHTMQSRPENGTTGEGKAKTCQNMVAE